MMSESRISVHDKYYPEARLSWKTHLLSWLSYPSPRLLIRYEDMLADTAGILRSTINFINQFIKIKIEIDEKKISKVVEECKFDKLQKLENKIGFDEKKNNPNNFFRKGKTNEWQEILSEELTTKLTEKFSSEMKKLNYI
jgi:hypothetical protein